MSILLDYSLLNDPVLLKRELEAGEEGARLMILTLAGD